MTQDAEPPGELHPDPTSLRTLVLNADYRPLSRWPPSVISAGDALVSVWKDRAVVVEEWERAFFRSQRSHFPVPKVIALKEFVHYDAEPKFCRRSILLRDGFSCQYCGGEFPSSELTYDHVTPRARGGRTEWTNIVSACVECNSRKEHRMPDFSGRKGGGLRPLKPPRVPTRWELEAAALKHARKLNPSSVADFESWVYWLGDLNGE